MVLYTREIETWRESTTGLSPVETYATVVLPELDGATTPVPILGLERSLTAGFDVTNASAIEGRPERFAGRVLAWTRLRRTKRRSRRIALVAYDYPPGIGNAGNASYLDVSASLASIVATTRSMKRFAV